MSFDSVRDALVAYGIWAVLILTLVKFLLGIFVALKTDEFKWFYISNFFKSDGIKLAAFAIILGVGRYGGIPEFNTLIVSGAFSAVLVAGLLAGIVKNVAHLFPEFAAWLPEEFREPARLRLGNPKNVP